MKKILNDIKNENLDVLQIALGTFAPKLHGFLQEVSLDHKDLELISDGLFNSNFSSFLEEIISLASIIYNNNLSKVGLYLESTFRKFVRDNNYSISNIDRPSKNGQFIRLVNNPEIRRSLRERKLVKAVNLDNIFKKNKGSWNSYPCDFSFYERNSLKYLEELDKAIAIRDKYQNLGLPTLAQEVDVSVQKFESQFKDTYNGYYKLRMSDAAIILARQNNCIINELNTITRNGLPYQCLIHPFYTIENIIPLEAKNLILVLDSLSLFDHYFILCPSSRIEKRSVIMGDRDGVCYFLGQI